MRILITGDRFWNCNDLAAGIIRRLVKRYGPDIVIVHGGATGVDESFATAAKGLGVAVEAHPVTDETWQKLGKRAGPLRNRQSSGDTIPNCLGKLGEIRERTGIAAVGHPAGTLGATGVERLRPRENVQRLGGSEWGETD